MEILNIQQDTSSDTVFDIEIDTSSDYNDPSSDYCVIDWNHRECEVTCYEKGIEIECPAWVYGEEEPEVKSNIEVRTEPAVNELPVTGAGLETLVLSMSLIAAGVMTLIRSR